MYFLALSQAPPPDVIEIATNKPVTITPKSIAPSALSPAVVPAIQRTSKNSTTGESTGGGRADGVTLGHCLGGIADSIQRIGRLAHIPFEVSHFGDAAGIVRHRTEGIERHNHAGERQHGGDGDGDAEEARELVGHH